MRPQGKESWLLILATAVMGLAIMTAAQWAYPVKAAPKPEMDERWRKWAEQIRQHEKSSPTTTSPLGPSPDETDKPSGGSILPGLGR